LIPGVGQAAEPRRPGGVPVAFVPTGLKRELSVAKTISGQWRELPEYAQWGALGIGVGAIFGVFTKNVAGAIGIGIVLALLAFVRPTLDARGARKLVVVAAIAGCLVIGYGTADESAVNGLPIGGGQFSSTPYVCGSVMKDPIKNPTSDWAQVEHTQTTDGFDNPGSTSLLDSCSNELKAFRTITAVLLGITLLSLLGTVVSESKWRRRQQANATTQDSRT